MGTVLAALPAAAVARPTYYADGSTSYQRSCQGTDANYGVVADSNQ